MTISNNEAPLNASYKPFYSTITAEDIAVFVNKHFSVADIDECIFWCQGINDTYKLKSNSEYFIARVYRHQWRTKAEILFELDVLGYLSIKTEDKYVANNYANTSDRNNIESLPNDLLAEFPASEGVRYIILTEFADGCELNFNDQTSVELYGKTLARLHNDTNHFNSAYKRSELDLQFILYDAVEAIKPYLIGRDDLAWFSQLIAHIDHSVSSLNKTGDSYGLCHGDYNGVNAHFINNTVTLFDFDCCGLGYRIYDVATFKWACITNGTADGVWDTFLDEYLNHRSLSQDELLVLDDFVLIRQIWIMGVHCKTAIAKGWLSKKYFDFHFSQLKQWQQQDYSRKQYIY